MARQIEDFFMLVWQALSGDALSQGWQTLALPSAGACTLLAGRHFPGNEEALLVGFETIALSAKQKLPEGRGFLVAPADPYGDGKAWLALTRKPEGSLTLFADMVRDVADALDGEADQGEAKQLSALLGRVRAWQNFMSKTQQPLMAKDVLGLVGELTFLRRLLEAGITPTVAVEAWVGPRDYEQDFVLGSGAVEVKVTLSTDGFPVKIGSLEQLSDAEYQPLFLAGIQLVPSDEGENLPAFVEAVAEALASDKYAHAQFMDQLLLAGYHPSHADRYPQGFAQQDFRLLAVDEGFPRLVSGNVPEGIRKVSYEIDLDKVQGRSVALSDALQQLGVI